MRLSPLRSLAVSIFLPTVPPLLSLAANILLPTDFAKYPPSSQPTPSAISTATSAATTPTLEAIVTSKPTLAIADLGRSWTETSGSAEHLSELVSYDERVARKMKEEGDSRDSKNRATISDDDGNEGNEVEVDSGVEKGEERKCWFFHCEGWQW